MADKQVLVPEGWFPLSRPTSLDEVSRTLCDWSTKSRWMFRGESRWFDTSISSLGRCLREDAPSPLSAEASIIRAFEHAASGILSDREIRLLDNVFGLLIVMQHYGAPTRLLDWTFSPWVAAYHAASMDGSEDGVIWAFNPEPLGRASPQIDCKRALDIAINEKTAAKYVEWLACCADGVLPVAPGQCTDRMLAQQCAFTLGHPARIDHRKVLGNAGVAEPGSALVAVVPKTLKAGLMRTLASMNITGASLFPGLDGVGRTLREIPAFKIEVRF